MIRLLFLCLALSALAMPIRAATVVAGQDANGSEFAVSPQHPLAVMGPGTNGAFPTASPTYTPLGCPPWLNVNTGSAVLLSSVAGGIPAGATLVDIVPSVAVVMRDDGSAPGVAGPGIPVQALTIYPYSANLAALQFIAQTASGTIATCFYK
jgi:hypothetical protein